MEKFNELLEKLNSLKIAQKSIDWVENIPEEIYKEYLKDNYKELAWGLDVDTHRWYETSISVIEIFGKLLGVRHITILFSESTECEDCCVTMKFYEMEEIPIISYQIKPHTGEKKC